jgi:hypothetical protein
MVFLCLRAGPDYVISEMRTVLIICPWAIGLESKLVFSGWGLSIRKERQMRETLAGGTAGAAVAGGLIGAAAGAIIADATRPGWCYYWRHHHRHYVRC